MSSVNPYNQNIYPTDYSTPAEGLSIPENEDTKPFSLGETKGASTDAEVDPEEDKRLREEIDKNLEKSIFERALKEQEKYRKRIKENFNK